MAQLLDDDQIAEGIGRVEWSRRGDAIERGWKLDDFAAAIAFVNRIAERAEAAGHHPDVLVHDYNRVRVTLSTHSAGGLTEADFALAAAINEAAS